jgi:hypothetical protein
MDMIVNQALQHWRPSTTWASPLREATGTLFGNPLDAASWATLALMLGDSGMPELCFFVCRHARSLPRTSAEDQRLAAHEALCALDLGFGSLELGGAVHVDAALVEEWLGAQLQPFDGSLERAAVFCLCLAALRTEAVIGPSAPTVAELCDPKRFRLSDAPRIT